MSSGPKRLVHNTRERLVSTDHNREQAFMGAAVTDILRFMLDAQTQFDANAAGAEALGTVTGTPLRATILNGIRVRPEIGTVNTFVEPGVLGMVDPDSPADPDDVVYKWIDDPGVQTAGSLVLTPNASGSARIDVVECTRTESTLETDNRDLFNVSTGLFAPLLVDKVKAGRLSYRVRAGTPGAGYPAAVADYLPLAVALVPNGATTWNDCTLWDVRPLAIDFELGPFDARRTLEGLGKQLLYSDRFTAGAEHRLSGIVEGTFAGRRVGGKLSNEMATPAVLPYIDLKSSTYREPGFAAVANKPWYLYLAFPFGLPRWCMYTPSLSGSRVPSGCRGIPIFTQKVPTDAMRNKASVAISIPTPLGLGSSTTDAVAVAAGCFDNAGPNEVGIVVDGGETHFDTTVGTTFTGAVTGGTTARFDVVDGTIWPTNARRVRLRFSIQFTGGASTEFQYVMSVRMSLLTAVGTQLGTIHRGKFFAKTSGGGTFDVVMDIELPLIPSTPAGGSFTRRIDLETAATAAMAVAASPTITVEGWTLGP